ncbi:hypothetical protein LTR91_002237 [Friedmanniomyces endolithicus]|uniref:Uncharacterized protein n=1 Tax=Friedmanniomyces endolithicus TaxID=329885 RepID=A0AAN6FJ64_9PEZI|nr:hypothetical protein LTR35_015972 [Friedmanniomyces endolithicus]KAK0269071.1 hypothetical protein LTS00_017405 [Friedmanniomyces endolithicus]KAK0301872.1 hypothetical protein LTR01_009112 [Friedmanniomyces endolithicus]KAK0318229.1 hypothetical protein LTR82_010928 [Friedmanniomyces endolithicus]KAK0827851.1 hypothetical protein LTR73_005453 [Friedmanniomyces endolithicus]
MATSPPMFAAIRLSSLANNDDAPTTTSQDPFWHATPRTLTSRGDSASGNAAMPKSTSPTTMTGAARSLTRPSSNRGQTVPQPPTTKQSRQAASPTARRPQCTHMTMDRVHSNLTCHMCGKGTIGWLYVCSQDRDFDQLNPSNPSGSFSLMPNGSGYYDAQARLAESVGITAGVVEGIRNRAYSFEQIDKLIQQKVHLLATIRRQETSSTSDSPQAQTARSRTQSATDSIIASVGTTAVPPVQVSVSRTPVPNPDSTSTAQIDGTIGSTRKIKSKKQNCSFQVCHACRPFFKDRLYMSFEMMLSGRLPAITEEDIKKLPMINPAIVRNLGVRQPYRSPIPTPLSTRFGRNVHQGDGTDEDASDWTPTSATVSEVSDSDRQEEADLYPCPGAGICPLWSRYSGCAFDAGQFDDGLRALNHGFGPEPDLTRMTPDNSLTRLRRVRGNISDTPGGGSTSAASSISLPSPGIAPLTPITPTDQSFEDALTMRLSKPGKAATICGPYQTGKKRTARYGLGLGLHRKDSSSSLGSEVEVEGGVALRESAVESGDPDILTDDEQALAR